MARKIVSSKGKPATDYKPYTDEEAGKVELVLPDELKEVSSGEHTVKVVKVKKVSKNKVVITSKKAAAKPVKKTSVEKPVIEKKEIKKRIGVYPFMTEKIIEKKHTDNQLVDFVKKEFPVMTDDKLILKQISACRYFLNAGKRKGYNPKESGKIEQLVINENGKLIPYSEKPKKAVRKVIDPANDPLQKLGIIGEKKKEEPVTKKAVKKSPVKKAVAKKAVKKGKKR